MDNRYQYSRITGKQIGSSTSSGQTTANNLRHNADSMSLLAASMRSLILLTKPPLSIKQCRLLTWAIRLVSPFLCMDKWGMQNYLESEPGTSYLRQYTLASWSIISVVAQCAVQYGPTHGAPGSMMTTKNWHTVMKWSAAFVKLAHTRWFLVSRTDLIYCMFGYIHCRVIDV